MFSKSLGSLLIWSGLSNWAFWHLSKKKKKKKKKNRLKNEFVSAEKLNPTRRVCGDEMYILGKTYYFMPYFIDFGAGMCIFEVKESI